MVVCFGKNGDVKFEGSELYFTIMFQVWYDVHGVYVCIRKFHVPKRIIWVTVIYVIIHNIWVNVIYVIIYNFREKMSSENVEEIGDMTHTVVRKADVCKPLDDGSLQFKFSYTRSGSSVDTLGSGEDTFTSVFARDTSVLTSVCSGKVMLDTAPTV